MSAEYLRKSAEASKGISGTLTTVGAGVGGGCCAADRGTFPGASAPTRAVVTSAAHAAKQNRFTGTSKAAEQAALGESVIASAPRRKLTMISARPFRKAMSRAVEMPGVTGGGSMKKRAILVAAGLGLSA